MDQANKQLAMSGNAKVSIITQPLSHKSKKS